MLNYNVTITTQKPIIRDFTKKPTEEELLVYKEALYETLKSFEYTRYDEINIAKMRNTIITFIRQNHLDEFSMDILPSITITRPDNNLVSMREIYNGNITGKACNS